MGACESCRNFYVAVGKDPECKFGFSQEEDCGLYESVQFVKVRPKCKHEADWDRAQLVLEHLVDDGGAEIIIDVPCEHCPRTGSFSLTALGQDINWD